MIQPNDFIDVSRAAAGYVTKFREAASEIGEIDLIWEGEATDTLKEWKSAHALLVRIQQHAASMSGEPVKIDRAYVKTLAVDDASAWKKDDEPGTQLAVNLVPSPGARLHTVAGFTNLWPGQMQIVPHNQFWCLINYGPCAAAFLLVRLVVDVPGAG